MTRNGFHRPLSGLCALVALGALVVAGPALAGTTVTYTGQGFNFDGTTYNLNDERCGVVGQGTANDGGTGQFADWNGPGQPYQQGQGYLVWVLSANGATSARPYLPDTDVPMIQVGGTFKYASQYYLRDDLVDLPVTAIYQGKAKGSVQLVVSHGCQPAEIERGAWCSPGFWGNASDNAWGVTGVNKTAKFNETVVPEFYDTPYTSADLPDGPTLILVLTDSKGPGGANKYGAASDPYGLNAFNATGAYLTEQIPGYVFDPDLVDDKDNELACPIDNHGNFKNPE